MNANMLGLGNLLDELTSTDLNGLLTAGNMYRSLLREIARSGRYHNPLSIVRLKVFDPNNQNERDRKEITSMLSDRLGNNVRVIDYAGTWTEDEFLIFLPETDFKQASKFAHKIKSIMEQDQPMEIHMGIAQWEQQDDAASLLEKAQVKP